jgi:hypothetical protein
MPFRLARALRARLKTVVRHSNRVARRARTGVELLEDRRLLSVSIVAPYSTAVEGGKVGIVADFTADTRPTQAYVGWGDGSIKDLTLDYDPATGAGTVYGLHDFGSPGRYTVTFSLRQPGYVIDAQTFTVDVPGDAPTPAPTDDGVSAPGGATTDGALVDGGASLDSVSAGTAPAVDAVLVDSTAWASTFRSS